MQIFAAQYGRFSLLVKIQTENVLNFLPQHKILNLCKQT